jgi:hypothetical protein
MGGKGSRTNVVEENERHGVSAVDREVSEILAECGCDEYILNLRIQELVMAS